MSTEVPWSGDIVQELRHAAAYLNRAPSSQQFLLDLADQASMHPNSTAGALQWHKIRTTLDHAANAPAAE